jgi:hypothetical protein
MTYNMSPIQAIPLDELDSSLLSSYLAGSQGNIQEVQNYGLYASLLVGSNGDPNGDPTSDIGDVNGEENWATFAWDTNLNGGFDSGTTPVVFDASANGDETLSVEDLPSLSYNAAAIGSISSVVIEAAVEVPAETKWSDITVQFYQGGTDVENLSLSAGPDVNTINTPNAPVASQILTVFPSNPNCDRVVVAASLRMQSPGNHYPPSNGMFGNIYIMGSSKSGS